MKSSYKKGLIAITIAAMSLGTGVFTLANKALAYNPTLSIYNQNSGGNYVNLSISGAEPNTAINIYSLEQNGQTDSGGSFGSTDANGNFNAQEPFGNDSQSGIVGRYAMIGNDRTNTVSASTYSSGGYSNGQITFSNSNPSINVGVTQSITIYSSNNGSYSSYYVSSNSNSSVVSAYISGTSVELNGLSAGTSTVTVCASGYSGNQCGILYANVVGGTSGSLSFNTTNPSLYVGQTASVSIEANGSNNYNYYIYSNSNPNVVSASITGSSVQLYGMSYGSSSITVCAGSNGSYGYNNCGTIYATVNNNGVYGGGSITFSNSNPSLSLGQETSVYIYTQSGSYSGYYISSNSNSAAVSANISGTTITLIGLQSGSATLTVCGSGYYAGYNNSQCGTIYVTIGGGSNYGSGTIAASPSNPFLNIGQSVPITLSQSYYNGTSGNSYYINSNSNSSVVSASISGNILTAYGENYGTDVITVCTSNYYTYNQNNCLPITVTVSSNSSGQSSLTFNPQNVSMVSGQQATVTINSGNYYTGSYYNSSYYISSNANPTVANATISASVITIYASAAGSDTLTVCTGSNTYYGSNNGCGYVYITVNGQGVLGATSYPSGELIQEGQQISIVYQNTKTAFGNWAAFTGFGYNSSMVQNIGSSGLVQSSYVITNSNTSHPWGAWISMGSTVYFVSQQGLIPVPSYAIFTNNGGQSYLVVPANRYDYQLPMLSNMNYNDPRVQ